MGGDSMTDRLICDQANASLRTKQEQIFVNAASCRKSGNQGLVAARSGPMERRGRQFRGTQALGRGACSASSSRLGIRNARWCRRWRRWCRARRPGLISEVLVADGGSQDETAAVADVAGCDFLAVEGPLGRRLKAAAAAARAPWLMFLRPGTVLDAPWTGEVGRFVRAAGRAISRPPCSAAAVRRAIGAARIAARCSPRLGALPRPEQGLLIAKQFYDTLGGHSERAADPEGDFDAPHRPAAHRASSRPAPSTPA